MSKYPQLRKALSVNQYLSKTEIDLICRYIKVEKIKRNEHYIQCQSRSGKIGFLLSGIICGSYLNAKGEEQVKYFVIENQFFTDINIFFYRQPAGCDIKAILKCRILTLKLSDYEMLVAEIPALLHVMHHWSVIMLLNVQQMLEVKCVGNAQARYQHFIYHHPVLARRLPLKYIAMLLQIAPPSLSRLRRAVVMALFYVGIDWLPDMADLLSFV
jgi:CRP-like cAMP-binding protein